MLEVGSEKVMRVFNKFVLNEHQRDVYQHAGEEKCNTAKDFQGAIQRLEHDAPEEDCMDYFLSLFLEHRLLYRIILSK